MAGEYRKQTQMGNSFLTSHVVCILTASSVAHFKTIFPGHYYGVANHMHVLTHNEVQSMLVHPDGSRFVQATHNGRIFFDQQLIYRVEATAPYNLNRQPLTLNADDLVLQQQAEVMDPIVRYTLIGKKLEDGVLGWIRLGIDPTTVHPMDYAGRG